jgi:hypothetical protein
VGHLVSNVERGTRTEHVRQQGRRLEENLNIRMRHAMTLGRIIHVYPTRGISLVYRNCGIFSDSKNWGVKETAITR